MRSLASSVCGRLRQTRRHHNYMQAIRSAMQATISKPPAPESPSPSPSGKGNKGLGNGGEADDDGSPNESNNPAKAKAKAKARTNRCHPLLLRPIRLLNQVVDIRQFWWKLIALPFLAPLQAGALWLPPFFAVRRQPSRYVRAYARSRSLILWRGQGPISVSRDRTSY